MDEMDAMDLMDVEICGLGLQNHSLILLVSRLGKAGPRATHEEARFPFFRLLMNTRLVAILAVIVIAIIGVAVWFLNSAPPMPPLPAVVTATPVPVKPTVPSPEAPSSTASTKPTQDKSTPAPVKTAPAPREMAEWETKIDQVLNSNSDNTEEANRAVAQMLINMLPTFPPEGQAEAASHITNLIDDKEYKRVQSLTTNARLPQEVLDVLVTDLMNREDAVKLPTLFEIAKNPAHPHHEEAQTDLQIFLDEDFGTDWPKWETAMKAYLKKQAEETSATN